MTDVGERRPSVGYYLTFAAAVIGMVLLTIAIDGARRAIAGGNAMDAVDSSGVVAFAFIWALLYYQRLAFAGRLAAATRAAVTLSLRILLAIEVTAAAIGSWYVLMAHAETSALQAILVLADLLQIGTMLWLVRYSRE